MNHVVHYHLPLKDRFTHRNGRTARMTASGTAYVLAHEERKKMEYLDYGMDVYQLPTSVVCKTTLYQTIYISGGRKQAEQN
jgi:superfamily II DNA/RNA helicase